MSLSQHGSNMRCFGHPSPPTPAVAACRMAACRFDRLQEDEDEAQDGDDDGPVGETDEQPSTAYLSPAFQVG